MIPTGTTIRRRLLMLMAVFLGLFVLLAWQLFRLQVLERSNLMARAQSQWTQETLIAPRRGAIYDRNGRVIAMSATAYTASVSPRQVTDAKKLASVLAPILDVDEKTIHRRASDKSKGGVTLKRQLDVEVARELKRMIAQAKSAGSGDFNGLYIEEDTKRYYPMGSFMSQLIGITTIDGVGQSGLEASLNKYLSGKPGRILGGIDGKGQSISEWQEYVPATDGSSVTLTIDSAIQTIVEQAAREAMTVNGAKAVRVLVMQPKTGEILAMCVKPDFDLNDPPRDDLDTLNERMRNRVVTDAYEPGSTFKIITTAAALESKLTHGGEGFYCSGSTYVEGGRVRCWGRPHGAETMAQALNNSCNPVFVELGMRLGVERFYDYLEAFGFGASTQSGISGEAEGILIPRARCKRVDIARIGFGQSIAVTPLQLLTAACAAINGGNRMRPYIVREINAPDGSTVERATPTVVQTAISEKTSATMRKLLEDVVTNGGGKNAFLKGYRVGGKTGTAQLYVDGIVSSDTHIGSFLGFAPMDDPQVAVLVIVDEAAIRPDYGSVTAAPFAKEILERTLAHLRVAPDTDAGKPAATVEVPDLTGQSLKDAMASVKASGFSAYVSGTGTVVVDQMPAGGAKMPEHALITLYVEETPHDASELRVAVPDVTGMSIVQANRVLRAYALSMTVEGTGIAVGQTPAAGEMVAPTSAVAVVFAAPGADRAS